MDAVASGGGAEQKVWQEGKGRRGRLEVSRGEERERRGGAWSGAISCKQLNVPSTQWLRWMDGWRMDGWMDGWINEWVVHESMTDSCVHIALRGRGLGESCRAYVYGV